MNNVHLFIINGGPESGKDTFVNLVAALNCSKKKVINVSSVDDVKTAATILGWDGKKTEKSRKFLSDIKALSEDYNSHSITKIVDLVRANHRDTVYFYHVREMASINKIKQQFTDSMFVVKTVYVDRDSEVELSNTSDIEASMNSHEYDIVIDNSTDKDNLIANAKRFCEIYLDIC